MARTVGWWLMEADALLDTAFDLDAAFDAALERTDVDRRGWQALATLARKPVERSTLLAALASFQPLEMLGQVLNGLLTRGPRRSPGMGMGREFWGPAAPDGRTQRAAGGVGASCAGRPEQGLRGFAAGGPRAVGEPVGAFGRGAALDLVMHRAAGTSSTARRSCSPFGHSLPAM